MLRDLLLQLRQFTFGVGQEPGLEVRILFQDGDADLQMVALLQQPIQPDIPEFLSQEGRHSPHAASRARPRYSSAIRTCSAISAGSLASEARYSAPCASSP